MLLKNGSVKDYSSWPSLISYGHQVINEALKLLTVAEDLLVLAIGVVAQQDFAVLGPGVVLVDAFAWGVVFKGHDL